MIDLQLTLEEANTLVQALAAADQHLESRLMVTTPETSQADFLNTLQKNCEELRKKIQSVRSQWLCAYDDYDIPK
jgi:hypothetical protein